MSDAINGIGMLVNYSVDQQCRLSYLNKEPYHQFIMDELDWSFIYDTKINKQLKTEQWFEFSHFETNHLSFNFLRELAPGFVQTKSLKLQTLVQPRLRISNSK